MLFTMDVGNTNINYGLWEGDELLADWRMPTRRESTLDEFGVNTAGLFATRGFSFDQINGFIIASVVPPMRPTLERFGMKYLKQCPIFLEAHTQTLMPLHYINPVEMGSDRVAVSIAAYHRFKRAVIIIDMGTATTFDCISAQGEHLGGAIAAGLRLSAEALFSKTSRLPSLELLDLPDKVIARDTVTGINVGLIWGYINMIDGLVATIKEEMEDKDVKVVVTGGLASLIASGSKQIEEILPDLTLEGLKIVYNAKGWGDFGS